MPLHISQVEGAAIHNCMTKFAFRELKYLVCFIDGDLMAVLAHNRYILSFAYVRWWSVAIIIGIKVNH